MKERKKKLHQKRSQIKMTERQQDSRIIEVVFWPPVVVKGCHWVPVGTIIRLSGNSQCLCVYTDASNYVHVTKEDLYEGESQRTRNKGSRN